MSAWREAPTLIGRHVTLRPFARSDRTALIAAFADGLENPFATTVPGPETIDGWYDAIDRETAAGRMMPFTCRMPRSGRKDV